MTRKPNSSDDRPSNNSIREILAFLLDALRILRGNLTAKVIFLLISSGVALLTTQWWVPFIQTLICDVWEQDCNRIDASDRLVFWSGCVLTTIGILLLLYYYPRQSYKLREDHIRLYETTERTKSEKILINAVEAEVTSRLNQSLHNQVLINLGKTEKFTQVKRPWDYLIKVRTRVEEILPSDVTIQQVFDRSDIQGRLLVLGQPGSGKTTVMLDLAKDLLERVKDPKECIPVLLNLSSWASKRQSIPEWIVEELKSKYGVPASIGKKWLAEQKLLVLFDGLDEVRSDRQHACVEALNQWISGDDSNRIPKQFVVCSRIEEYEQLEAKLQMNGAICLSELSNQQIEDYLVSIKQQHLYSFFSQNPAILNLVHTPLFLSMIISAEQSAPGELQALTGKDKIQTRVLDIYVSQMLGRAKNYTRKQMRTWLVQIASQLERDQQTEFLVERIQPRWLQNEKLKSSYQLRVSLLFGIFYSLFSGVFRSLIRAAIKSSSSLPTLFIDVLLEGLIIGLIYRRIKGPKSGLIEGMITGLIVQLTIKSTGIFILTGSLPEALFFGLRDGLFDGLVIGVMLGLGKDLINGSNLITPVEGISWSWEKVRRGLFYGSIVGLIFGVISGLVDAIVVGLSVGISSGLISGLSAYEVEQKVSINQGIWKSLHSGLMQFMIIGLGGALMVVLLGIFNLEQQPITFLSDWVNWLWWGLDYVLLRNIEVRRGTGLIGGLYTWIRLGLLGGLAGGLGVCLKHLSLRQILFTNGLAPWNYARFLNECSDCLLLQRIGGRFLFIHKSVQEHFSAMSFENSQT
ncbi:NACHT domain-containing protein [Acaryochloris marina]|uniref:NACHT domain-containing protein n=1 Tax=Acaryochloris marina (strain MBIC 11017) TaxID=329726 RepID=A8ZP39_ACAM1|nr:NACHT domain-containing protein [Acaryochloris marina]ABW32775.1 conserved hypothetical protein [Acaryochloris marina MBIC11017]